MFATTREEHRHGQILDLLESERGGIRIEVARVGAELVSLERQRPDGTWARFLWRDGDVSGEGPGWKGHSTVMGYYVHRLLNQQTSYTGDAISGGTHGFLRRAEFPPPEFSSDEGSHLVYHLPHQEIPREAYPRKVDFSLTYRLLEEGVLEVEFAFANHEHERPAHLSFGLHPGFAVACLTSFRLLAPPGRYIRWRAPGDLLNGETDVLEHVGGDLPLDRGKLVESYLFDLREQPHRIFTLVDPASGRQLQLDYTEAPFLTVWSDQIGNFICVEPCWGLPDHHEQRPFEEKAGIQEIPPGQTLSHRIRIQPSLVPVEVG